MSATVHFTYCAHPLRPTEVEPDFSEEANALRAAGFGVTTCSDTVVAGTKPLQNIPPGATLVYRRWMLNAAEYGHLERAASAAGARLFTSAHDYLQAHHLPNWYQLIADLTPETRVFAADDDLETHLRALAWPRYFVKDYVKSLKTSVGSIISDSSQIRPLIAEMIKFRGDIEGGICVRRVEAFQTESERRFFVLNRTPCSGGSFAIPEIGHEVARRVDLRFFSVDVVRREDGVERIVEIGDGQVSDLVGWEAETFARMWLKHGSN